MELPTSNGQLPIGTTKATKHTKAAKRLEVDEYTVAEHEREQ